MIDLYLKRVFSTRACRWYPDFPYSSDPAIASAGSLRSRRCLSRRNDDFRAACCSGIVGRDCVVGGVCREIGPFSLRFVHHADLSTLLVRPRSAMW
jgi:hypothetical protein